MPRPDHRVTAGDRRSAVIGRAGFILIPPGSPHEETGQRISDDAEGSKDVPLAYAGFHAVRRVIIDLAVRQGAQVLYRRPDQDGRPTIRDVEPLFGLRAAHDLELGARGTVRQYMIAAREAGYSWEDIGRAADMTAPITPGIADRTVGEVAFSYVTGRPNSRLARLYPREVEWTCLSCDSRIADRGPAEASASGELGHAEGCAGLAATLAATAERDADLEAGA